MRVFRAWFAPQRKFILSFLLLLLLPAAAVVWLGVRLIEQDRALESRQLRERRESSSDRVIASLEQSLTATERRLAGPLAGAPIQPGDDAIWVAFEDAGITAYPKDGLPYYPALPPSPEEPAAAFAAGEELEFRARDYAKAAEIFRQLAASSAVDVRAGALLRLARNLRKAGNPDEALQVYRSLAQLPQARLYGLPADLVARRARAALLDEMARTAELRNEALALQADLLAGRWRLDRGSFFQYTLEAGRWVGTEWNLPPDRQALSDGVDWLWREWKEPLHGGLPASGRRALPMEGSSLALVWQSGPDPTISRMIALVAGPRFQRREWFSRLPSKLDARITLAVGGQSVFGAPMPGTGSLQRTPAETGLPWTVLAADADSSEDPGGFVRRRRVLLAGVAMLVLVVVAGSYFTLRAVSRELAVAQLQSDFVAAVSHEFRTPLTSLRQFNELLSDNDALPVEKRRTFYQAQARATERLHRLVESLLDFGRMEAGARPYRMKRVDAADLVRGVADEFESETAGKGFTLERSIGEDRCTVDADPEALTRALWNLLDNAVKYSGDSRIIWVSATRRNGSVAISVRDRGLGIPRHEQTEIFHKFVRGAASRANGIKGTGIGLTMVSQIVAAHHGEVTVESKPGEGSTFTIVIPEAPCHAS